MLFGFCFSKYHEVKYVLGTEEVTATVMEITEKYEPITEEYYKSIRYEYTANGMEMTHFLHDKSGLKVGDTFPIRVEKGGYYQVDNSTYSKLSELFTWGLGASVFEILLSLVCKALSSFCFNR